MDWDLVTLRDHAAMVRRRWKVITLFILLGVGAGVGFSLMQSPYYTASSTLLVQEGGSANTTTSPTLDAEEVATQAQVVVSDAVAKRVIKTLHLKSSTQDLLRTVNATPAPDRRTVAITATQPTAAGAASVANAFANAYIALQARQTQNTQAQIRDSYIADLSDVQVHLNQLRGQLLTTTRGPKRADLSAEIQSLRARQAELQASLLMAEDPSKVPTSHSQVLQTAQAPAAPSSSKPAREGLLGGVVGLLIGLVVAYVRDGIDDTVRADQRLDEAVGNVPVLGRIPSSPSAHRGRVEGLLTPHSPVSEAYRTLSTNLRFLLAAGPLQMLRTGENSDDGGIVVISSAVPAEGKTSVATNVAVAAARAGLRVLLVDADLRNPQAALRFGIDVPLGLSDLLANGHVVSPYLQDTGVENIQLLAAGSVPPNPAELLASPRARLVWRELRRAADLVVVDTAPITNVADTLEIAGHADEVIIVVREGKSRLRHVADAADRLQRVGARLSGIVLNDQPNKHTPYNYGYAPEPTRALARP